MTFKKKEVAPSPKEVARRKIREACEANLLTFARLVGPKRVYGAVHEDLFGWWTSEGRADNTLCLLPRDHQKSHCAAVKAAWDIIKHPWMTILYVSATADLAEKQLYAIKNILTSDKVMYYWPNLINKDEGKREKWTAMEISVDHPKRKEEGVRDPSIKAAGLTTNITGFHANRIYLDDVVVPLNAYTEEGRSKVASMYSQLASIKTTEAITTAVGTRYHPRDLYDTLLKREIEIYKDGELTESKALYDVYQKVVETDGEYLWPKTQREDGRSFGFDENELAKKKAEYLDAAQFYAQYYNNPNDPSSAKISPEYFQYYDRKNINMVDGHWRHKHARLNVFAAIDFAFSLSKVADYTSIAVIGVDADRNYYILDLFRFKTQKIKVYFDKILEAHNKWEFRKLRAEVTIAQEIIVEDLKQNYIRPNGLVMSIDKYRPSRNEGTKEERMTATLSPRYENGQMWHYKGGNCQVLEEELKLKHPPHDDVMDSVTAAVDISVPPTRRTGAAFRKNSNILYNGRFGGIAT